MHNIWQNKTALLLTVPSVLVPVVGCPLVLWARWEFLRLHPSYLSHPPTISRAISDPRIGEPFANAVLLIAALISVAYVIIVREYALSVASLPVTRTVKIAMYAIVAAIAATQALACTGMVLTSEYTFANDNNLHMLGSYIFFSAQAISILLAGTLCHTISLVQSRYGVSDQSSSTRRTMQHLRFRMGLGIVLLTAVYGLLFMIKDCALPLSPYVIRIAYTQCEVLTVICYALFLSSYAVDTYSMTKR